MQMRQALQLAVGSAAIAIAGLGRADAAAPPPLLKVAFILPMTGPSAATGKQIAAAVRFFMSQNGSPIPGRRIELLIKDDGGVADLTRQIAQQLVVAEKVDVLAGFGLAPLALAAAPLATQSKTPMVVMAASSSGITEQSPYMVRTGFTLPQVTVPMAGWASRHGIHKVVTFVADDGPGIDAEKVFKSEFTAKGGQVAGEIRTPLKSSDFTPFLQKVADIKPDAVFAFLAPGQSAAFMKQFGERGLARSGIRVIATGELTDDDQLDGMGDAALGVVSSHHYSASHSSELNQKFVAGFEAANKFRPNFMAVAGYDGIRLVYNALAATKGKGGGEALVAAMKGQSFESPRGTVTIDKETGDIVQDVYIRRVERVAAKGNQLYNTEFEVQKSVKDPGKSK